MLKRILFLLIMSLPVLSKEITDEQMWWSVTAIGSFYQKQNPTSFKYWLEGQERLGDHLRHSTQRLLRPGLGYVWNKKTSFWLGFAWIDTELPLTLTGLTKNPIIKTIDHVNRRNVSNS